MVSNLKYSHGYRGTSWCCVGTRKLVFWSEGLVHSVFFFLFLCLSSLGFSVFFLSVSVPLFLFCSVIFLSVSLSPCYLFPCLAPFCHCILSLFLSLSKLFLSSYILSVYVSLSSYPLTSVIFLLFLSISFPVSRKNLSFLTCMHFVLYCIQYNHIDFCFFVCILSICLSVCLTFFSILLGRRMYTLLKIVRR